MVCNLGKSDRIFRAAVGVVLLFGGIVVGGSSGTAMGLVAVIPLVTAAVGSCPAYSLFKITTRDAQGK